MRRRVVALGPEGFEAIPSPCAHCSFWETRDGVSLSGNGDAKLHWMADVASSWGACGRAVVHGDDTWAYAQYGPPGLVPGASRFSAGPPSPDGALLCCIYVVPEMRGRGLGKVLLTAVYRDLLKRRIKAIEAFGNRTDKFPPAPLRFFLKNGFYVLRDDHRFPLVRLDLKAAVTWQENLQATLDAVRIPARAPARVPAAQRL